MGVAAVPEFAVVAIPAREEAARLPVCLQALESQTEFCGGPLLRRAFGIVVFANGCRDETAEIARDFASRSRFAVRVVEAELPRRERHAGGARRRAMDMAAAWLDEACVTHGAILTTDADSCVAPDWLVANLGRLARGADAVLGRISLDEEGALLPPALHARGKLESVYEEMLTEIAARLDPDAANPWPHHATISGASLALTLAAYRRVGGLPRVPLGEDKALVTQLRRRDLGICFAPEVRVVTSGRTFGRAPGGVADTLKYRSLDPSAPCDEALEPCVVALRRALWRGRLRRAGRAQWPALLRKLGFQGESAGEALTFGRAWERIEAASPALRRRALRPAELPGQIALASRLLRRLQALTAAYEDVEAGQGPALGEERLEIVAD